MRSGGIRSWLWWKLLPFYGWTCRYDCGNCDGRGCPTCGAIRPPWYAFPLAWAYRLIDKLGTRPFLPPPIIECRCDECFAALAAEDRAATVRLYGEARVAELEREANRG